MGFENCNKVALRKVKNLKAGTGGARRYHRSRDAKVQDRSKEVANGVGITGYESLFRRLAGKQLMRSVQPFAAGRQLVADFLPQLSNWDIASTQKDAVVISVPSYAA